MKKKFLSILSIFTALVLAVTPVYADTGIYKDGKGNLGVVFSIVGIIKYRKSKNLEYKHCLATAVFTLTVILIIFIVCTTILKNM